MNNIRHLTKKHSVAETLRLEILDGSLAPGAPLQQEEIAARLGVSSTPVREAFGLLEAEGFLENRPHRGVVVAQRNLDDLEDVYEIRAVLEALAVRRLARNVTPKAISELEDALKEAERGLKAKDVARARRANTVFHQAMHKATGSPTLLDLINRLIARSLFFLPAEQSRFDQIHKEHVSLLAAIKRGDGDRAARILATELTRNLDGMRRADTKARAVVAGHAGVRRRSRAG